MNREKNTRVRQIVTHPLYQQEFSALQRAEQGRIYCNHTMEHFLDVARICYILVLQDGADLPRELIYGAALLHDLGRYRQIADGTPHEVASAQLAEEIYGGLRLCRRRNKSSRGSDFAAQTPWRGGTLREYAAADDAKNDAGTVEGFCWATICTGRTKCHGYVSAVRREKAVSGAKKKKIWKSFYKEGRTGEDYEDRKSNF